MAVLGPNQMVGTGIAINGEENPDFECQPSDNNGAVGADS
jgi:hypothetical protein